MSKKNLTLIDGSGYIFRAYYGLPPMFRSDGLPCNAIYGFMSMMARLLEHRDNHHIAVVFDSSRQTFRQDIYHDYKANRQAPPEDLLPQFPYFRDASAAFGLPILEYPGYEADDVIATYAKMAKNDGFTVEVISGDKDLMQLVDDNVSMVDPMKNKIIRHDDVVEKFGVPPEKVIYVQALSGDSVDNIPGVRGIGPKIAAELINQYGTLDNLLDNATNIKQQKRREKLIEDTDIARISLQLVTLCDHVPVTQPIETLQRLYNHETLEKFLHDMEFGSLLKRLANHTPTSYNPPTASNPVTATNPHNDGVTTSQKIRYDDAETNLHYHYITEIETFKTWLKPAYNTRQLALYPISNKEQHMIGLIISHQESHAACCFFTPPDTMGSLLDDDSASYLNKHDVMDILQPYITCDSIVKIGHNIKQIFTLCAFIDCVKPYDDIMLQSFTLNAGLHSHNLEHLSQKYMHYQLHDIHDILGLSKRQKSIQPANITHEHRNKLCAHGDIIMRLYTILHHELIQQHLTSFYWHIEKDMPYSAYKMEREGVAINAPYLHELDIEFTQKLSHYEHNIYQQAGDTFNIASPKQLGDILFNKLAIPHQQKTKTGQYSTAHDILEPLAHDYPIVQDILHYRQYNKLLNTYIKPLPRYVDSTTQRIHTDLQLTGAQTGRLSSNEPNLQNIPIKDDIGKKIRTSFIAKTDYVIISLDYSQIELRILAEMAQSPAMIHAFKNDHDIHALTASQIFKHELSAITSEQRRAAKAINFGIIYGMSAFGLAKQIGVSRGEARDFINNYFASFDGIKDFFNSITEYASEHGYVTTLFGRRIHLPAITSSNNMQKQHALRQAMNAPIQGSAADIIKRAMHKITHHLHHSDNPALRHTSMILQVHDELLFEAPSHHADEAAILLRDIMQQAHLPIKPLAVDLKVEYGIGSNWGQAH